MKALYYADYYKLDHSKSFYQVIFCSKDKYDGLMGDRKWWLVTDFDSPYLMRQFTNKVKRSKDLVLVTTRCNPLNIYDGKGFTMD